MGTITPAQRAKDLIFRTLPFVDSQGSTFNEKRRTGIVNAKVICISFLDDFINSGDVYQRSYYRDVKREIQNFEEITPMQKERFNS